MRTAAPLVAALPLALTMALTSALAGGVLLSSPGARAGGFEYTDNGARVVGRAGAFVAKADDPMAINYNPGGLTLLPGLQLHVGGNLADLSYEFTRAGVDELVAQGVYPSATVANSASPFFAPSLALSYGADRWAVGFGVYGPGAYGKKDYPADGVNQFILAKEDVLLGYVTASGAYRVSDTFSAGVSLQYVMMPVSKFGLTIDGSAIDNAPQVEAACDPDTGACSPSAYWTRANLDLADYTAFAAIVGAHWKATDWLEVGVSSRVTPVYLNPRGDVALQFQGEGLKNMYESGELDLVSPACGAPDGQGGFTYDETLPGCGGDDTATMTLVLPPWVRLGARFVGRDADGGEAFDVELALVYELWSMLDAYEITFDGRLRFFNTVKELKTIRLPKNFRDTFAARLGGDVRVVRDTLTLRWGAMFETAASPDAYANLDFASFMRLGGSLGVSWTVGPVEVAAAYAFTWQPEVTVSEAEAGLYMQRPMSTARDPDGWDATADGPYPGLPINAGTYRSMFHTVSLSLLARFE